MNEEPKKLTGMALLNHVADLRDHIKRGGKAEMWGGALWCSLDLSCTQFSEPLWKYRKVPRKAVRYANLYDNDSVGLHPTRAVADTAAKDYSRVPRLACVRIEIPEGQFDE